jgi:PAS domain S-box-containing protein
MSPNTPSFTFRYALDEQIDQIVFAYEIEPNRFSYLNPYFEQVFGLQRENLYPLSLLQMVHQEDQEYVREVYEDLLKGK